MWCLSGEERPALSSTEASEPCEGKGHSPTCSTEGGKGEGEGPRQLSTLALSVRNGRGGCHPTDLSLPLSHHERNPICIEEASVEVFLCLWPLLLFLKPKELLPNF